MSNYLFVAGNRQHVEKIKAHFQEKHNAEKKELNFHAVSKERAILVIERRNSETESSIFLHDTGHGLFFRGQALDHETSSIILGGKGFFDFQNQFSQYYNPQKTVDFEGSFILARWDENSISLQNDLYSVYRMLFFATNELIIASDSLFLISQCLYVVGNEKIVNKDVAYIKAWNASGLPNAPISDELIIKGAYTVQAGKHVEVSWNNSVLNVNVVSKSIVEIFSSPLLNYNDLVRDCVKKMYSSIRFLIDSFNPVIEFGLSGGIDSRLLLAICMQSKEIMDRLVITSSTSPNRIDDFNVVKMLSNKYDFAFNNVERKNRLIKDSNTSRIRIENTLGLWKIASLGVYDSFYMTSYFDEYPSVVSMLGVGAEPVKATSANSVQSIASSQHEIIRDTVRKELRNTIQNLGIDPNSSDAMNWFLLTYKAAFHIGFKTAQSSMLLRPYVQKSVFSIAIAEDNPFRNGVQHSPTVLHDMMILLDPELASLPYDTKKKNISKEYAYQRLEELGGPIEFDEMASPLIFGSIEDVNNGPAQCFLNMVNDFKWEDGVDQRVQLANMVRHNFENKIPDDLKEIYTSCYEKTLENLDNPKIELSAAGAMAARFIVFDLFDE